MADAAGSGGAAFGETPSAGFEGGGGALCCFNSAQVLMPGEAMSSTDSTSAGRASVRLRLGPCLGGGCKANCGEDGGEGAAALKLRLSGLAGE